MGSEDTGNFKLLSAGLRVRSDRVTSRQDDYVEQRRTLLESVEAGRQLEERVDMLERREPRYARNAAIEQLECRIAELERNQKLQRGLFMGVGGFLKAILIAAAGSAVTYFVERHK